MLASRVPVLHEVRDITMARTGDVALVSYENKVCWYNAFDTYTRVLPEVHRPLHNYGN